MGIINKGDGSKTCSSQNTIRSKVTHDMLQGNTRYAQANTHDTLKLTQDTNTGWWHEGTLYRAAPCLNRTGNEAGQFPKFLRSSSSNIHAPFLLISSDHGHKTDILLQIRAICLLLRKSGIFSKQPFLAPKSRKMDARWPFPSFFRALKWQKKTFLRRFLDSFAHPQKSLSCWLSAFKREKIFHFQLFQLIISEFHFSLLFTLYI